MPATNVLALDGIPTEIGAIMDPMGNAFHTVLTAEIPGSTVFVAGCGPIGCFAVGIARAAGASRVIASDVNPKRLALAEKMGAHVTVNAAKEDVVRAVLAATGNEGADVVCEMSGVPAAVHQAFAAVRLGGRVQLLGLPTGPVPVDFANEIIFKGLLVYGVIGRKMYETWHQMRRFLSPDISHTTSAPSLPVAASTARTTSSLAAFTVTCAPIFSASARRLGFTSEAITRDAPAARAMPTAKHPIGPHPATHTVLTRISAVSTVWKAFPIGSMIAPISVGRPSRVRTLVAGIAMNSANAPSPSTAMMRALRQVRPVPVRHW